MLNKEFRLEIVEFKDFDEETLKNLYLPKFLNCVFDENSLFGIKFIKNLNSNDNENQITFSVTFRDLTIDEELILDSLSRKYSKFKTDNDEYVDIEQSKLLNILKMIFSICELNGTEYKGIKSVNFENFNSNSIDKLLNNYNFSISNSSSSFSILFYFYSKFLKVKSLISSELVKKNFF